jgi:hypothetical protein
VHYPAREARTHRPHEGGRPANSLTRVSRGTIGWASLPISTRRRTGAPTCTYGQAATAHDRRLVQRHARYRRTVWLEFYSKEVSAPDISERYRALLALLRPHLPQAYLGAERRRHSAPHHWERLRLLAGCDAEALDGDQARSVGSLAARAATTDIVNACVVEGAMRRHDLEVSSDEGDLQAIAAAVSRRVEVDRP